MTNRTIRKFSAVVLVCFGVTGMLLIAFGNPEMTDRQLLIAYWRDYALLAALVTAGAFLLRDE